MHFTDFVPNLQDLENSSGIAYYSRNIMWHRQTQNLDVVP